MPNYIYKCTYCGASYDMNLPMSSDPKIKYHCFATDCDSRTDCVTRRIGRPSFPKKVGKVFAGDWFKKTYGIELGEGSMNKATQAEDRKTLEREFRKDTGQ